jgi:glycosyltransferase involved in cell wall biosynthesis
LESSKTLLKVSSATAKALKITHIITSIEGGAGKACLNLHQALLKEKIDSKVLYLYGDAEGQAAIYQVKTANTFLRRVLRKTGLSGRKEDLIYKKIKKAGGHYQTVSLPYSSYQLHQHPLVIKADVIHLHWVGDFVDLAPFFANVAKPIVWTLHDMNPIEGIFHFDSDQKANPALAEIDQRIRSQKLQIIEQYQPHLVTSSLYCENKIKEKGLNCASTTIPCIIDTEKWSAIPKRDARKALGLANDCITIGFGAQALRHPFKGYTLFREALSQFIDEHQLPIQLLTFGAHDQAEESSPNSKVKHLGKINQQLLNTAYAAMDIFIVSSAEESFGQVGFEALLCNTPIIASSTGAMPEYATFPSSVFETNHIEQLKQHLINAIALVNAEDISLKHIRNHVINWYAAARPLQKHIELYQTLTA